MYLFIDNWHDLWNYWWYYNLLFIKINMTPLILSIILSTYQLPNYEPKNPTPIVRISEPAKTSDAPVSNILHDEVLLPKQAEPEEVVQRVLKATVTAFNTVESQTDGSPCVAAGGWICGRNDVVACPRSIPLGTWVEIEGMGKYECMDRMNGRFPNRFDISFDKDVQAAIRFGKRYLTIEIL